MNETSADVVVVGGSVGGLRVAESLRRLAFTGSVTVLESGDRRPYDRPALSKKVLDVDGADAAIELRTTDQLALLDIDLRLGCSVVGLDTASRTVRLADGSSVRYDDLVIATGADARRLPGVDPDLVHYLRNVEDARGLRAEMASAKSAAVVGGGFIGSEVAGALHARGIEVTVVEPTGDPLARVLGPVVGARLALMHESRGVALVRGRGVATVRASEQLEGTREVVLDDGTIMLADLVVIGIGATHNTGWLAGSGVAVSDGVECDEYCRASAPHVFAVGDVARWPNALFGESMRVEHWTNAMEQAAAVAWNIKNPDELRPFAPVPYVWSDQYGSRLQILGRPRPTDETHVVLDEAGSGRLVVAFGRGGRLTGAFLLDAPQHVVTFRRALAAGASLSDVAGVAV